MIECVDCVVCPGLVPTRAIRDHQPPSHVRPDEGQATRPRSNGFKWL